MDAGHRDGVEVVVEVVVEVEEEVEAGQKLELEIEMGHKEIGPKLWTADWGTPNHRLTGSPTECEELGWLLLSNDIWLGCWAKDLQFKASGQ